MFARISYHASFVGTVALAFAVPSKGRGDVLIFGDSLSKEYAIEFSVDLYPEAVKSWSEILDAHRNDEFGYGDPTLLPHPKTLFDGHETNWSFPGGKIDDFVDLVEGKTLVDGIARSQISGQLRDGVDRFVLFVGGNDVDSVYGRPYDQGLPLDGFIGPFVADTRVVLGWVLQQNPSLEVVLVGIPHVGATPKVRDEFPFDPVKTGRVTAEYAKLNTALEALAVELGVGFADIFDFTSSFVDGSPFCFQGYAFANAGDVGGASDHLWLGGLAADDFHPNTIGQAIVANAIIGAFNDRYQTGSIPLSTEEVLDDLLGYNPDIGFSEWLGCFGLAPGAPGRDSDGDGASDVEEFGLGTDPSRADVPLPVTSAATRAAGGASLEIGYRQRLNGGSDQVRLVPEWSFGVDGPWIPVADEDVSFDPVAGFWAARWDASGAQGYLRLNVALVAP